MNFYPDTVARIGFPDVDREKESIVETVSCPDPHCQAPAEVVSRFELPSANGLIAYISTRCARRHVYTVAADPRRATAQHPLPATLHSIRR